MHLGNHGVYTSLDPIPSSLFLAAKGKAQPVIAANLLSHPLPTRMDILSACETGMKLTMAGEYLIELDSQFLSWRHCLDSHKSLDDRRRRHQAVNARVF